MKRFENILVAYDDAVGGDDALGQAVALARENRAQLAIVTVLREGQNGRGALDETEKRCQRLADSVVHAGVPEVSTALLAGTPSCQIIGKAIADRHDLVVISAEAGNSLREKFFGRTAAQLMRKCPCPVWVVKPGQSQPYIRILAAVDPPAAVGDDGLTRRILNAATALAARDRAVLHVVHAWDVDGPDLETMRSETTEPLRREILGRHQRKHEAEVGRLLGGIPMENIDCRVHLRREVASRAIARVAAEQRADLIVMGMGSRYGIPPFLAGTTAEAVLATAGCGVLTVKPDGFVPPVAVAGTPLEALRESGAPADRRMPAA